jgi:hypothetical protein
LHDGTTAVATVSAFKQAPSMQREQTASAGSSCYWSFSSTGVQLAVVLSAAQRACSKLQAAACV